MKKILKRTVSWIMVLCLLAGSISIQNKTAEAAEQAIENEIKRTEVYDEPTVVEEVLDERTADSTTVLLSNGMKQTTYYSDEIYFKNSNGEYVEYDSELIELDSDDKKDIIKSVEVKKSEKDSYKYVNKEGDSKQYLPKKINEDTPLVMIKDEYVISFAPMVENNNNEKNVEDINALSGQTNKVSLEKHEVEDIYEENKIEEKKVVANYSDKTENLANVSQVLFKSF